MRGGAAAGAERGSLAPVLALWLAPGLFDAYLVLGGWPRPEPWQFAVELGLLAAIGRTQWRLARGWGRSALLPAAVFVVFALLVHAPTAPHQMAPFLLGLVGGAVWIVRTIERRWRVPLVVGTVVALGVVLWARWLDVRLGTGPDGRAVPSVLRDVVWPLVGTPPPPGRVDAPPVVVVSIDTLRADAATTMASMRRLAERGASWPRAMSTSSWTMPALASLQTGLMPEAHGAVCLEEAHCQGVSAHVRTLAEDLAAAGWTTAAVVANPWVGAGTGFARGFHTFRDATRNLNRLVIGGAPAGLHNQDDARAIDAALAWLDRAPARGFYLWIHLLGPHMPYLHSSDPHMRALDPKALRSSYPLSDAQQQSMRAAYDAEVAYTDRQVMRLLDALDSRGILDDGVIVFTADHGEEFLEHGGIEHGHSHHGEVIDVPLVLVAPGVAPGERRGVASLIDVAPTVRAIAGLAPGGLDLRDEIPSTRTALAWGGLILHLDCSARDAHRRVIARDCSREPSRVRVYDLAADPDEQRPAPWRDEDPLLQRVWQIRPPARAEASELPVERLRALGYLQ